MSEYFNLNEQVKEVEEKTKKQFPKLKKYLHWRYLIPVIILLAIPVTVVLALVSQDTRSRAGGGLPIARVDINPGIIISSVAPSENPPAPVELSALAFDNQGNPLNYGVNYDWSISSTDTVGTLTKTNGVISQFLPYKAGCGVLTVTATYNGQTLTKAATIVVKAYGGGMPSCAPGANIDWTTNYVSLIGENSYINVGTPGVGDRFMINMKDLSYSSTPTYYVPAPGDQSYRTDIVGTWKENDQNMKLKMTFRYWPGSQWQLYQLQTLERGPYERWIDYPLDKNTPTVQNSLGSPFIADNVTFNGGQAGVGPSGIVHFDKLKVQPFLDMSTVPTPTSSVVPPTPTPTQCVRVKPFITNIEPLDGIRKVMPGQSTFYKFWLRNDNPSTCPPTTYRLAVNIKNQYVNTENETDITLKSGESKDTIVNATVQKGAPLSSNPLSVSVWDVYNVSKPESFIDVNLTITDIITPGLVTKKMILVPLADAYVRSSAPTTNFGSSKILETDTNPNEISYFKFNLKGLAGKKITSASFILKVSEASGQTQIVKRADDSTWTESGINYNNKPSLITSVNPFMAKSVGGAVSVSVLGPVKVKQGENLTLGVISAGNDKAGYYSRESTFQPQLIIEYQ